MKEKPLVLYIEDNLDNLKLVTKVLLVSGFRVHGAVDGQSGMDFARAHHPDLILVDIHLPDIDGFTITAQLRQESELTQMPIIALTANVTQSDREQSFAAGCDGFIEKPIDVDRLPEQLQAFLVPSR